MILQEIFLCFAKIGFTSFGGLSMIPLISSEMLSRGWLTAEEMANIVAIAEMTPGPLGLNCATFAGIRAAGLAGAAAATLGILSPTLTIALIAAVCFEKFKNSRLMQDALFGIRPTCVALVCGVIFSFAQNSYFPEAAIQLPAIIIGIISGLLLMKGKLSIPKTIAVSAVLGLLLG